MAPSGAVCVAAQDGLWMMGSARGKRWVQTRQKPKLNRKAVCKKQHIPVHVMVAGRRGALKAAPYSE
jgi:hypothetical protein